MKKTVMDKRKSIGGNDISTSKDKERGTWKIYLRYVDWQGMKQIHTKFGFTIKREALEYEREFLVNKSRDWNLIKCIRLKCWNRPFKD